MKKVLITGGTRGIGKAVALKLAEAGSYKLAICARNSTGLENLKKSIRDQYPEVSLLTYQCDLSTESAIDDLCEKLKTAAFSPEILINNAGRFIRDTISGADNGNLQHMLETNLFSAYHLTRKLLPGMMEKKRGQILNICSTAGIQGYANAGSYSISKHALLGFSRSLREELKPFNIRVTALSPGATLTDSWKETNLPDSRFISPEDVAKAVGMIIETSENTVVEDMILRPLQGDINDQ